MSDNDTPDTPEASTAEDEDDTYTVIEAGGVPVVRHASDTDTLHADYQRVTGNKPGNKAPATLVEEIRAAQAG